MYDTSPMGTLVSVKPQHQDDGLELQTPGQQVPYIDIAAIPLRTGPQIMYYLWDRITQGPVCSGSNSDSKMQLQFLYGVYIVIIWHFVILGSQRSCYSISGFRSIPGDYAAPINLVDIKSVHHRDIALVGSRIWKVHLLQLRCFPGLRKKQLCVYSVEA